MKTIIAPPPEDVFALGEEVLDHRVNAVGDCADVMDDGWFPPEPFAGDPIDFEEARAAYEAVAKALCRRCPVRVECLALHMLIEAKDDAEPHGVAGGIAPWQRSELIRVRHDALEAEARRVEDSRQAQVHWAALERVVVV